MKIWFVTRHPGAVDWARQQRIINDFGNVEVVAEIQPEMVQLGDTVIGSLPVSLAAQLGNRGARYLHIAMNVPIEARGKELTAEDMQAFGAQCLQYTVIESDSQGVLAPHIEPEIGTGVHVCLVSDQPLANLLPILKRRPAMVELVCTPEMRRPDKGVERLQRALAHYGYGDDKISLRKIGSEAGLNFNKARKEARELREQCIKKYPNQHLTLNATGGTKILSTAFVIEFRGIETVYMDSQGNPCLRFLADAPREPEPVGAQITSIADYLYCQGYALCSRPDKALTFCFGGDIASWMFKRRHDYKLRSLNMSALDVEKNIISDKKTKSLSLAKKLELLEEKVPVTSFNIDSGLIKNGELLSFLCRRDNGLLRENNGKYYFSSYSAMRYLSGGWLEEWVGYIAKRSGADDVAINVEIKSLSEKIDADKNNDKYDVDNELDLMILHKNRLLIAECKTINWQGVNGKQDVFNKMDALGTHARGLFGKSLLLSSKPLDEKAARRAKTYGIAVLEDNSLKDLEVEIKKWMGVD